MLFVPYRPYPEDGRPFTLSGLGLERKQQIITKNMEKFYFFKTVKDGSRERLSPLSGQTVRDGSAINPNFNTKGS